MGDKCSTVGLFAKNFLIPNILSSIGFSSNLLQISDDDILFIINNYIYEAGVRKLKEKLNEIYTLINYNYIISVNSELPIINKNIIIDSQPGSGKTSLIL